MHARVSAVDGLLVDFMPTTRSRGCLERSNGRTGRSRMELANNRHFYVILSNSAGKLRPRAIHGPGPLADHILSRLLIVLSYAFRNGS